MERIKFTFTGGFPIKQKLFAKMQKSYYEVMEAFVGHLGLPDVGNFIINGCEVVGSNITPGKMYIDGDLCAFEGGVGTLTTKIKKILLVENAPFKNGNNNPVYLNFEAKINTGGIALQDFITVLKVNELENVAVDFDELLNVPNLVVDPFISNSQTPTITPQKTVLQRLELLEAQNKIFQSGGGIFAWGKSIDLIPAGFQAIPDMPGRILVNIDRTLDTSGNYLNPEFSPLTGNLPGRKSGEKSKTLDLENIPKHNHDDETDGIEIGSGFAPGIGYWSSVENPPPTGYAGGLPDGSTKPFNLIPLVQTCEFIQWVGL